MTDQDYRDRAREILETCRGRAKVPVFGWVTQADVTTNPAAARAVVLHYERKAVEGECASAKVLLERVADEVVHADSHAMRDLDVMQKIREAFQTISQLADAVLAFEDSQEVEDQEDGPTCPECGEPVDYDGDECPECEESDPYALGDAQDAERERLEEGV